jgi:hypothetical protein
VRRLLLLAVSALTACTSPVEADFLEYADAVERDADLLLLADATPEAPQPPEQEPEDHGDAPYIEIDEEVYADYGPCGLDVRAHGFPAMHRSGAAVTYFSRQPPGNADGPLSSWLVETALATGSTTVHDIVDDSGWIGEEDADQCPDDRQDLEERIRKANERLQDYRTLPELDVVGDMPEWMYEDREPQVRAVPARQRPIRVGYSGERLVFRVPGVKVVHAQTQNWWVDDPFCLKTPHVRKVFADAASGVAVAEIDYSSGGCLCDDGVYHRVITLPPAVFEEVAARPTSVLPDPEDAWEE